MYHNGDDIGALVADIGSFSSRIGFAGEDSPRAYIPSVVGVLHSECSGGLASPNGKTMGQEYRFDVTNYKENMGIESPVQDGLVSNWDLLEQLWEHSLVQYCNKAPGNGLKDTPVLIAEKPYTPISSRHK
jgi:actin-related protein